MDSFLACLPDLREETNLDNELSSVYEFANTAFDLQFPPGRREHWKGSPAGWEAAMATATRLLAAESPGTGWEIPALAALCCFPAARNGGTREVRARAYRLIARAFEGLYVERQTAPASHLVSRFLGPWESAEPDPLDPLPEHLIASVAAAEAAGGFSPRWGLPFEPSYAEWGKLSRGRQLELLRRASRLLEVRAAPRLMRRDDLTALEHCEVPSDLEEADSGFVPTPRRWLLRQMRRRRHLIFAVE